LSNGEKKCQSNLTCELRNTSLQTHYRTENKRSTETFVSGLIHSNLMFYVLFYERLFLL
jgi:hypothetical protein